MVDLAQLPEETVVALRKTGVAPETFEKAQQFTAEEMGVPRYGRLQIPTSMIGTAESIRVLDWLSDQLRQLRRENVEKEWSYALRLHTLINAANLQLQKYTKSSSQK